MKRGKDGEKIIEPMFPRLHVKDAEKGGPRAPPRNKMALYEQLSIPSHRFSHVVLPCSLNNTSANPMPPMSQGGGNDRSTFISSHLHPSHSLEQQCSQYSNLSTPLVQREKRKKMNDDDYAVPVFNYSTSGQEFDKFCNDVNQENLSPSNCTAQSPRTTEKDMIEHGKNEDCRNPTENNPQGFMAGWVKSFSCSPSTGKRESSKKQTISCLTREPGDKPGNSIDRLRTIGSQQTGLCTDLQMSNAGQNSDEAKMVAVTRRNSPNAKKNSPSEDYVMQDLSTDSESNEMESLDVSETSILGTVCAVDVTPDDVVGVIGQKQFWKARRAIANQQRVFAVQVFELHRLIKVQKLIAASPHLLLEDSAYLGKPIKTSGKKTPIKAIPNLPEQKDDLEKPEEKNEGTAENTVTAQDRPLPPNSQPMSINSQEQSNVNCDPNTTNPWYHNQSQGHQWLVPVMSPSEGLIYKLYPGPGFVGQASGGCGPLGSIPIMSNFTPAYSFPVPPTQYQLSSSPPFAPHGYFPPCSIPIMKTAVFSGSSVEQMVTQRSGIAADAVNSHKSVDVEVQESTTSIPSERQQRSNAVDGRNMLPLIPTLPAIDASKPGHHLEAAPGRQTVVIRVVPHNSISASESAARIFRAIQEGRKQYDSV